MNRSRKLIVLSHCIINSNSKVVGLSNYSSVMNEILSLVKKKDFGIIQLPCPEMYFGLKRWGMVKEQMDSPSYRIYCRKILLSHVDQISHYLENGYFVKGIIGIDGSPSCGVDLTCSGNWCGELILIDDLKQKLMDIKYIDSKGIFMEEFIKLLGERNIVLPFIGITEENYTKDIKRIEKFVNQGEKNEKI